LRRICAANSCAGKGSRPAIGGGKDKTSGKLAMGRA
jgi:hypothetical protein